MTTFFPSSPTLISSPLSDKGKAIPLNTFATEPSRTAYYQDLDDLERSIQHPLGPDNKHGVWKFQADNYFPQEPVNVKGVEKLYRSCCCNTRRGMIAWVLGFLVLIVLLVLLIIKFAAPNNLGQSSPTLSNGDSSPQTLSQVINYTLSLERNTVTVTEVQYSKSTDSTKTGVMSSMTEILSVFKSIVTTAGTGPVTDLITTTQKEIVTTTLMSFEFSQVTVSKDDRESDGVDSDTITSTVIATSTPTSPSGGTVSAVESTIHPTDTLTIVSIFVTGTTIIATTVWDMSATMPPNPP